MKTVLGAETCELSNVLLLQTVLLEKASHAGESCRGGEVSHQTFLQKQRNQQGGIQRHSA